MDRKRVAFIVYVDLDPIPGEMHSQESAQNIIRNVLVNAVSHLQPYGFARPDRATAGGARVVLLDL